MRGILNFKASDLFSRCGIEGIKTLNFLIRSREKEGGSGDITKAGLPFGSRKIGERKGYKDEATSIIPYSISHLLHYPRT